MVGVDSNDDAVSSSVSSTLGYLGTIWPFRLLHRLVLDAWIRRSLSFTDRSEPAFW